MCATVTHRCPSLILGGDVIHTEYRACKRLSVHTRYPYGYSVVCTEPAICFQFFPRPSRGIACSDVIVVAANYDVVAGTGHVDEAGGPTKLVMYGTSIALTTRTATKHGQTEKEQLNS